MILRFFHDLLVFSSYALSSPTVQTSSTTSATDASNLPRLEACCSEAPLLGFAMSVTKGVYLDIAIFGNGRSSAEVRGPVPGLRGCEALMYGTKQCMADIATSLLLLRMHFPMGRAHGLVRLARKLDAVAR